MKKRISKIVTALISISCLCNIMTASYDSRALFPQGITSASSEGSSASYSETGILNVNGNVFQGVHDNLSVTEVLTTPSVSETGASVSFDEATGTLTLSGNVVKEEVQAWAENENVKKIICAEGTVLPADCSNLFTPTYMNCYAKYIDLSNAKTSNVTDMSSMFYCCKNIESLDLSSFDTSNVRNMSDMFFCCESLKSLDLSSFDTSNVRSMSDMFNCCGSLKSLDLSSFDTSNVQTMSDMFYCCESLKSLDLSNFDTSKVKFTYAMFADCSSLESLDLRNFDTSKVTDMGCMFYGCSRLKLLDISSSFDTSNVDYMASMFSHCSSLESLDLRSFDTSKVTYMADIFQNCDCLTTIFVSNKWSTESLKPPKHDYDVSEFFLGDINLVGGNGTKYDPSRTGYEMARIDTPGTPGYLTFLEGNGTYYAGKSCVSFDEATGTLTLRGNVVKEEVQAWAGNDLNIIKCAEGTVFPPDCSDMFSFIYANSIDLSNADTSNVTNMSSMFLDCVSLVSVDLNGLDTSNVTNMSDMFGFCNNLEYLDLNGLDTSSVTNMSDMFGFCNNLEYLDLNGLDTSSVTNMSYMFSSCKNLESLDISSFDTSNVTNMSDMFCDCNSLEALDISSFDTSNVTNMSDMFSNCYRLKKIIVSSKWNTNSLNRCAMFGGSYELVGGNGTQNKEDIYNISSEMACIDTPETPGYLTKTPLQLVNLCRFSNYIEDLRDKKNELLPGVKLALSNMYDQIRRKIDNETTSDNVESPSNGVSNTNSSTISTTETSTKVEEYKVPTSTIEDDIKLYNQLSQAEVNATNSCSKNTNNTFLLEYKNKETQFYQIFTWKNKNNMILIEVYQKIKNSYNKIEPAFGNDIYPLVKNNTYYIRAYYTKPLNNGTIPDNTNLYIYSYKSVKPITICDKDLDDSNYPRDQVRPTKVFKGRNNILSIFEIKPRCDSFYDINIDINIDGLHRNSSVHVYFSTNFNEVIKKPDYYIREGNEVKPQGECYFLYGGYTYIIGAYSESDISDEFTVIFRKDNWVYAPNGGVQEVNHEQKLYIPKEILKEALKQASLYTFEVNTDLSECTVEEATDTIMKQLELDDSIGNGLLSSLTIVSAIKTGCGIIIALLDPEPLTKSALISIAFDSGCTFVAYISSSSSFSKWYEAVEFNAACEKGELNIVYQRPMGMLEGADPWGPWGTHNYIRKFETEVFTGMVLPVEVFLNDSDPERAGEFVYKCCDF